jgi:hypothetical protein
MARYRSRGTKGLKCVRKKRVRLRRKIGGRRYVMRCAKMSSRRSSYRGRRRRSSRKPRGMARRGSHCTRMKRVRLRRKIGGRRYVKRCANYR